MKPDIVHGDLLDQPVEVIINAWNRNVIPWWLLLPQGVSGAIKRQGGNEPFRDLARHGPIPLGQAVMTRPGKLPFKAIIHVAGINLCWMASRRSIGDSVRSAMALVNSHGFASAAFPIIGSGSGNRSRQFALDVMLEAFAPLDSSAKVMIVEYQKRSAC